MNLKNTKQSLQKDDVIELLNSYKPSLQEFKVKSLLTSAQLHEMKPMPRVM